MFTQLRDNLWITTSTSTSPCPTTVQGVVGSSCDGCSLLSLVLYCLYLLCGTRREVQNQSMEEEDLKEAITLRQTDHYNP